MIANLLRAYRLVRQCRKGSHLWDKSSDTAPLKFCLVCGCERIVKRRAKKPAVDAKGG